MADTVFSQATCGRGVCGTHAACGSPTPVTPEPGWGLPHPQALSPPRVPRVPALPSHAPHPGRGDPCDQDPGELGKCCRTAINCLPLAPVPGDRQSLRKGAPPKLAKAIACWHLKVKDSGLRGRWEREWTPSCPIPGPRVAPSVDVALGGPAARPPLGTRWPKCPYQTERPRGQLKQRVCAHPRPWGCVGGGTGQAQDTRTSHHSTVWWEA